MCHIPGIAGQKTMVAVRPGQERAANDTVDAAMKAAILLLFACLGGCSSGPKSDLPAIKEIRSAAAEWALVNREAARGRLTAPYAEGMRKAAREEIATQARALAAGSPAAPVAEALLALPADVAPDPIARQVTRLKQIEAALEPA